jgi:urea carboxylase
LGDYERFLEANSDSIDQFSSLRKSAFETELAEWHANGQFHYKAEELEPVVEEQEWPEHAVKIDSPVSGSVWELSVNEGDQVEPGQTLMILESMKMEIPLVASQAGQVIGLPLAAGARIQAGQTLCVLSGGDHE